MATAKKSGSRSGSGAGKFFFGFVFALVLVFAGAWAYLRFAHPPVAVEDAALPFEKELVRVPMQARINKEMQQPPFGISEDVYEAGAHIYAQQCAACHGAPGKDVAYAKWMYPHAPQLWKKHTRNAAVGVSDDEPGETFWKVKNGIRLTGMPAYQHILTDEQMWDVSLLLKNADQQLPDPVLAILKSK
jgi:mono/diheme cytochrome c family protein